ncbi:MAG: hypothetical protein P1V97_20615 [Planctomycetota bacterium]|nr:hypothetical protein [Planctomycetota bacterium]
MRKEIWSYSPSRDRREAPIPLPVEIHPHANGRLIINMPGWDGAIDGYQQKYTKLAEFLVEQGLGAVVRCGNHPVDRVDFEDACKAQIRDLTKTALEKAISICGSPTPELYFMGFSAGASAMAATAQLFPQLKALLLMAPSTDAGYDSMKASLSQFSGAVSVIVGAADLVVGSFPREVATWGPEGLSARSRRLVVIPQCDHQFRGARNGQILSQAPLWAFGDLDPFPHPDAGIILYD